MASREMTGQNRSKHIGHASEGHLRGLLLHMDGISEKNLTRKLPFETPVESDAILLDEKGRLRAIFIVAFWDHAGSSEKKLYRTRTEFNELVRTRAEKPHLFAPDFRIITILYGSKDGWKAKVLADLTSECAPAMFLPDLLGSSEAASLVAELLSIYSERWEAGNSDAREHVCSWVAGRRLTNTEKMMLQVISECMKNAPSGRATKALARTNARLPEGTVHTRYRQSLGVLSLFSNSEIVEWLTHRNPTRSPAAEAFARRAFFLDMGIFSAQASITGRKTVGFLPRAAVDVDGRYTPHRPDFVSWQDCAVSDLIWILDAHRGKAARSGPVFAGGAFDQWFGNYLDICDAIAREGTSLLRCIEKRDKPGAQKALMNGNAVQAEVWHPAHGRGRLYPLWSMAACALATATSDRSTRTIYDARTQEPPDAESAKALVSRLISSSSAQELFREVVRFSSVFPTATLESLASLQRPLLLKLDEPCSWLADGYMTLTTNSSHNPLNEILVRWLAKRFPRCNFQGWPNRRSVAISAVIEGVDSRRQWCVVGKDGNRIIAAETKSVTANNWGNKSKELYDRVSELRKVISKKRLSATSLLLFDGDLTSEVAEELRSGIGHDEVWSVDEVLAELRAHLPTAQRHSGRPKKT